MPSQDPGKLPDSPYCRPGGKRQGIDCCPWCRLRCQALTSQGTRNRRRVRTRGPPCGRGKSSDRGTVLSVTSDKAYIKIALSAAHDSPGQDSCMSSTEGVCASAVACRAEGEESPNSLKRISSLCSGWGLTMALGVCRAVVQVVKDEYERYTKHDQPVHPRGQGRCGVRLEVFSKHLQEGRDTRAARGKDRLMTAMGGWARLSAPAPTLACSRAYRGFCPT